MEFESFFLGTALFLGIVPFLILYFKGIIFNFCKAILPFIWITAIASIYEAIAIYLTDISPFYWTYVYSFLEFLGVFYFFHILHKRDYKFLFYAYILLFLTAFVFSMAIGKDNNNFVVIALQTTPTILFILVSSCLWFISIFDKVEIENLWRSSTFYFVSGLAIYYSGTFILFLMSDLIAKSNLYLHDFWLLNTLATVIFRFFLIVGVCKMNRD